MLPVFLFNSPSVNAAQPSYGATDMATARSSSNLTTSGLSSAATTTLHAKHRGVRLAVTSAGGIDNLDECDSAAMKIHWTLHLGLRGKWGRNALSEDPISLDPILSRAC